MRTKLTNTRRVSTAFPFCISPHPSPPRPPHAQGISAVVEYMDAYALTRTDFDSINDMTKFKSKGGWAADPTKELTTRVKTAFTKEANKSASTRRVHSSFMMPEAPGKRGAAAAGKRKKKAAAAVDNAAIEPAAGMEVDEGVVADVVDDVVDDDEDDEDDEDAQEKKKARLESGGVKFVAREAPAKKGKGKAKGR